MCDVFSLDVRSDALGIQKGDMLKPHCFRNIFSNVKGTPCIPRTVFRPSGLVNWEERGGRTGSDVFGGLGWLEVSTRLMAKGLA